MKKGYKILLLILLLSLIIGVGTYFYELKGFDTFKKDFDEKYNFEISYPKSFEEVIETEKNSEIIDYVSIEVSGEVISEYMQNLNLVETIRNLKSSKMGVRLIIEAIETEKTELSLEEICNRYSGMFQIYNDEHEIISNDKEIVNVNGVEVGKVKLEVTNKNQNSIVIAYLISLDNREITITFITSKDGFDKYEKTITKIINSLIIY